MKELTEMKKLTEKAIKMIEGYPDSFWDREPTWSYKSLWARGKTGAFPSELKATLNKMREQAYKDPSRQGWQAWSRARHPIQNTWNRCRREAHKRTGMDKVLKKEKLQKQQMKLVAFDEYKAETRTLVRELVPELLALDHLLGEETINRKKLNSVQNKLSRLWNKQKLMIKNAKGTNRLT